MGVSGLSEIVHPEVHPAVANPGDRRPRVGLLKAAGAVFLFSLALRLVWVSYAQVTPISDFANYDGLAIRWLETGEFGAPGRYAYRTPAYPAFLAGVYAIFGHSWKAAAFVQAGLGGLASGLVVLLAGYVVSVRGSVLAGLLHTVSPTALAYVPVLAGENLFIPLMLLAILALALADNFERIGVDLACAASGLAYGLLLLTRPAALFFLPALLILASFSRRKRVWRRRAPLVLFICAAVVVVPWVRRNATLGLGCCRLATVGGINLWMGNNDLVNDGGYCSQACLLPADLPEGEKDSRYLAGALEWMKRTPKKYGLLCLTRALRVLGTEADTQAAQYLTPNAHNDEAVVALYRARVRGQTQRAALVARAENLIARNETHLGIIRALWSPLVILAMILASRHWRRYAPILLPAIFYIVGLSATYFEARFREAVEPLLAIVVAALLADVLFGSKDLGGWPSRSVKGVAMVIAVLVTIHLHAAGIIQHWYRIRGAPEQIERTTACLGYQFSPVAFEGAPDEHQSFWRYGSDVRVEPCEEGLRCEVEAGADTSDHHYGGVRFPVSAPEILLVELTFLNREAIEIIYVDGHDRAGRRLRWEWRVSDSGRLPGGRLTYLFSPGKRCALFHSRQSDGVAGVETIHVFLRVATGSQAGFILHRAAIGRLRTGPE